MKPSGFSHFVFADFSGDPGMKLGSGSSKTMTYAWVIVKSEDYEACEKAVYDAKRFLSIKLTDEVKYTSIKRHKNKSKVLELLSGSPISIYLVHALKAKPIESDDIIVQNVWPVPSILQWLQSSSPGHEFKMQLIIDKTKSHLTDLLTEYLITKRTEGVSIKFGDSKGFQLLQLADIVAGYFREYLEMLDSNYLPPCPSCPTPPVQPCHYKRKAHYPYGFKLFRPWFRLIIADPTTGRRDLSGGFQVIPLEYRRRFRFLDCVIFNK